MILTPAFRGHHLTATPWLAVPHLGPVPKETLHKLSMFSLSLIVRRNRIYPQLSVAIDSIRTAPRAWRLRLGGSEASRLGLTRTSGRKRLDSRSNGSDRGACDLKVADATFEKYASRLG